MRHSNIIISLRKGFHRRNQTPQKYFSRRGFTLVEILVALGIFMLLMLIIMVPLRAAMDMLHMGKAKVDVQTATQQVIDQMRRDLTRAVYVFPNAEVHSVTGRSDAPKYPYDDPAKIDESDYPVQGTDDVHVAPYFKGDPCDATTERVGNLARIDMVMPKLSDDGSILTPIVPGNYIVTYYARRHYTDRAYHPIDNPILLYRAQIPSLVTVDGDPLPSVISDADAVNANIYNSRYDNAAACTTNSIRSAAWLTEDEDTGEPDLEWLTNEDFSTNPAVDFIKYGSHVAATPRGVGMETDANLRGYVGSTLATEYIQPKSTFVVASTRGNNIVDQVTINLRLQTIDKMGADIKGQNANLTQTIDLPNVRKLMNVR